MDRRRSYPVWNADLGLVPGVRERWNALTADRGRCFTRRDMASLAAGATRRALPVFSPKREGGEQRHLCGLVGQAWGTRTSAGYRDQRSVCARRQWQRLLAMDARRNIGRPGA